MLKQEGGQNGVIFYLLYLASIKYKAYFPKTLPSNKINVDSEDSFYLNRPREVLTL